MALLNGAGAQGARDLAEVACNVGASDTRTTPHEIAYLCNSLANDPEARRSGSGAHLRARQPANGRL
eukprot:9755749-Lingulodinium_polyedra.AAC.1